MTPAGKLSLIPNIACSTPPVYHLLNDEWLNQLQLAVIKYQLIYLSVRDSKQGTRGFPASYNTETSKCHHIFNKVKDYVRN